MRRRRNPEIIAGRVNADGSIAAGDGFTVAKTGTGAYTVTLAPGSRLIGAIGTPAQTASAYVNTSAYTERSFAVGIGTVTTTPAATDAAFSFIAAGVQQ